MFCRRGETDITKPPEGLIGSSNLPACTKNREDKMHFVSECCKGEKCGMCHRDSNVMTETPATHKVGEEILPDEPQMRHNYTQYVCCEHFKKIFGPWTHID